MAGVPSAASGSLSTGGRADVRAQLKTIREADKVAFENAIHALVLGAIVCGLVDARRSSAGELIDAIFAPIPGSPSAAEGPWEVLRLACARGGGGKRDSREDLQVRVHEYAGTSEGRGGARRWSMPRLSCQFFSIG